MGEIVHVSAGDLLLHDRTKKQAGILFGCLPALFLGLPDAGGNLNCGFDKAKKLLGCWGIGLILFPGQHCAAFQVWRKRNKGQCIVTIAQIKAGGRANAAFYHIGGVENQIEGGCDLNLLKKVSKPA